LKHAADENVREITMRRGAGDTFYVVDEALPMLAVRAENADELRLKLSPLLASCCGVEDFQLAINPAPLSLKNEHKRPRRVRAIA
jgi:hypothetical protein